MQDTQFDWSYSSDDEKYMERALQCYITYRFPAGTHKSSNLVKGDDEEDSTYA